MHRGSSISALSSRVRSAAACVAVIVLLATLLAACGSAAGGGATSSGNSAVFRDASVWTVTTWDPRASAASEPPYMANVYEPLLYANPPGSPEAFTPCLATSWGVSKDGLTWTFHLRQGVKFHDGTPFNAAAVKYSIEATKKLNQGVSYIWYPVKKITTPDNYTVKVITSFPTPLDRVASAMFAAWMFSPKTRGKSQEWWNAPHEAGTGPYTLVSYKPNDEVVFKRNPDYWGGWKQGQFEQVVVKQVADSATQRQMLEAGEVDFADGLSLDAVPALEPNPQVKIIRMPSVRNEMLMLNTQRKTLSDVRVRQAISYAMPYQDLILAGANGYAKQSAGPLPRNLYPHDPNATQYSTDLTKAKQLLSDAGYGPGELKLLMTYPSDDPVLSKLAPLVKEGLGKVGISIDLQPLLFEQQWAKAKGPEKLRQDVWAVTWWPGYPDGYDTLYSMFHSESEPLFNMSYWYNQQYDHLIDSAFSDEPVNAREAQRLYDQAQQMLVSEAIAVFLFDPDMVYGVNPSLKMEPTALNLNYSSVLYWYRVSR